jgi:hypothetical protein
VGASRVESHDLLVARLVFEIAARVHAVSVRSNRGDHGTDYLLTGATTARITCPECGFQKVEEMPGDACQRFYRCEGCGALLRPREGDCCVFCSYADAKCPPMQTV